MHAIEKSNQIKKRRKAKYFCLKKKEPASQAGKPFHIARGERPLARAQLMSVWLKGLFTKYNVYTKKHPLQSISLTTGVILGLGDLLEQSIENRGNQSKSIDIRRALSMSTYGLVIYGPFCSLWYNSWLPKLVPITLTGATQHPAFKQLSLKILYDETF